MGSKKSIGLLSVALAGATLGFTDSAYGLASYDASASLFLGIGEVRDAAGNTIPKPAELTITGIATVNADVDGTVGVASVVTDAIVDPNVPTPLDSGDGIEQLAGVIGSAGEAPPASSSFGLVETTGTLFLENNTGGAVSIDIFGEFGWGISTNVDDAPSEDAHGEAFIAIEGPDGGILVDEESNTIADGPVMLGDGDGFDLFIFLEPGQSETISVFVDAAGSARDRGGPDEDVIPEPVTAILGGLGMAALAAGTGRRR